VYPPYTHLFSLIGHHKKHKAPSTFVTELRRFAFPRDHLGAQKIAERLFPIKPLPFFSFSIFFSSAVFAEDSTWSPSGSISFSRKLPKALDRV
jgi:hypothetical protein